MYPTLYLNIVTILGHQRDAPRLQVRSWYVLWFHAPCFNSCVTTSIGRCYFKRCHTPAVPCVDICVHLRRLSVGTVAAHSAARNPVLCRKEASAVHGTDRRGRRGLVGMYFWMPSHAVVICNWTTGQELGSTPSGTPRLQRDRPTSRRCTSSTPRPPRTPQVDDDDGSIPRLSPHRCAIFCCSQRPGARAYVVAS